MKIVTNKHWREIQYNDDGPYIEYKGFHLPLDDFTQWNHDDHWHAVHYDSFFSGVVIRVSSDGDYCQVGTAYAYKY